MKKKERWHFGGWDVPRCKSLIDARPKFGLCGSFRLGVHLSGLLIVI